VNSPRLDYTPVSAAALDDFHALVRDPHVRRYLMDDTELPPEWSAARIADSERCSSGGASGCGWPANATAAR
jgi:hypothetical protein